MRASRVDVNQAAIVAAFRACGASVQPLHAVGHGVPDLLIGYAGRNLLVEVKNSEKPPSARKLTPDQVRWHESWRGRVAVVESPEAAIVVLQADAACRREGSS